MVSYRYPNAIASIHHFRYDPKSGKFVTITVDNYCYLELDEIIGYYNIPDGDFVDVGTNAGGGGVFQVRNGERYTPPMGWYNTRAFLEVKYRTYPNAGYGRPVKPVTEEEIKAAFGL